MSGGQIVPADAKLRCESQGIRRSAFDLPETQFLQRRQSARGRGRHRSLSVLHTSAPACSTSVVWKWKTSSLEGFQPATLNRCATSLVRLRCAVVGSWGSCSGRLGSGALAVHGGRQLGCFDRCYGRGGGPIINLGCVGGGRRHGAWNGCCPGERGPQAGHRIILAQPQRGARPCGLAREYTSRRCRGGRGRSWSRRG
ncbi:hypothetical protein FBZ96_10970 [Bradyrhizobium stylosanthis]|uniref:Uncharacterized protein n=1 Tax=Bradyrhizobium stylosanthis TaxID=1803665 RepID=A0A560D936_9BRAD|nr:hypothetical protein FBZ96_10970 [Bradyrhizobium stylosanthis]